MTQQWGKWGQGRSQNRALVRTSLCKHMTISSPRPTLGARQVLRGGGSFQTDGTFHRGKGSALISS